VSVDAANPEPHAHGVDRGRPGAAAAVDLRVAVHGLLRSRAAADRALEALLAEPAVPIVVDPRVHLAFVRVAEALRFSSG
jgi:hypothetical protein